MDGRWIAFALVLVYFAALFIGADPGSINARWKLAGVIATTPSFLDLRLFPAAQAELSHGGDPYVTNPSDPKQRPFNYPRAWLVFMHFPNREDVITAIGVALAALALVTILLYWGRLTPTEGVFTGVVLCSPSIMLGIEKGNTDLLILILVALGAAMAARTPSMRLVRAGSAFWLIAAVLKLYPIVAFAGLPARTIRSWVKTAAIPLGVFALYVGFTFTDVLTILRNTGMGWVQAYGARVPVLAARQAADFYGSARIDVRLWSIIASGVAAALVCAAAFWGWRQARTAKIAVLANVRPSALAGFQAGAAIYVATYLAGLNFDYRKCFLLLTLPQLFQWYRPRDGAIHQQAGLALVALLLSCGINFVLAGWPGFIVKTVAELCLASLLAALIAACRAGLTTPLDAHDNGDRPATELRVTN